MLVDKQSELMSDLLFTVHLHGEDDVTWKPPIGRECWCFSSVNVLSTKTLSEGSVFTSPSAEDETAILRCHPSHAKVKPFARQT